MINTVRSVMVHHHAGHSKRVFGTEGEVADSELVQ